MVWIPRRVWLAGRIVVALPSDRSRPLARRRQAMNLPCPSDRHRRSKVAATCGEASWESDAYRKSTWPARISLRRKKSAVPCSLPPDTTTTTTLSPWASADLVGHRPTAHLATQVWLLTFFQSILFLESRKKNRWLWNGSLIPNLEEFCCPLCFVLSLQCDLGVCSN